MHLLVESQKQSREQKSTPTPVKLCYLVLSIDGKTEKKKVRITKLNRKTKKWGREDAGNLALNVTPKKITLRGWEDASVVQCFTVQA